MAASSSTGMSADLTHTPHTASVEPIGLRISGDTSIMQRPFKVFPIGFGSLSETLRLMQNSGRGPGSTSLTMGS
jgi:hypothetical protein